MTDTKSYREQQNVLHETYAAIGKKMDLILTTGQLLMENGADTNRIVRDMKRVAAYMGIDEKQFHLHIMYTTLMLNISDSIHSHTSFRKCLKHAVDMRIISAISNVILDLVFIWGLGGGVGSAALATVLSQGLSAFLVFSKLIRLGRQGHPYGVSISAIKIDMPMLRNVISQGFPSGIQNSVTSISHIVVQGNINLFGATAMAGCGTHMKIEGFAFLPIMCFSMALATFVSQNLGANKTDRVMGGIRFGLICSIIAAQIVGVILFFGASFFVRLFSENQEVIYYGASQIKIAALFAFVLAIDHCSIGILRGFGRPVIAMGVVLAIWCLFRIVFITVMLHYIYDIFVIFWTFPLTWSMTAVLFIYFLLRETNKLKRKAEADAAAGY